MLKKILGLGSPKNTESITFPVFPKETTEDVVEVLPTVDPVDTESNLNITSKIDQPDKPVSVSAFKTFLTSKPKTFEPLLNIQKNPSSNFPTNEITKSQEESLESEELIFNLVTSLFSNEKLLEILIDRITQKLISETNRADLLKFANKHAVSKDKTKLLAVQKELNNYALFLNDRMSKMINNLSVQSVTKLYSEHN